MRALVAGMHDLGRGLAVVRAHPRLWRWIIAPAVATLVLLVAIIVEAVQLVDPVVTWLTSHLPGRLVPAASSILSILVAIGFVIAGLLLFVSVAGVVAGPFNELLSERVEAVLTGRSLPAFSLKDFIRGAALGVAHGLRRLIVGILGLALVFALGFVPVLGAIVAAMLGSWFAARGAAYDCYDAVLSRRSMSYRDKLAFLARYRSRTLGLGLAVAGMMLVPGLNLVVLGLGAAGATVAMRDLEPPRATNTSIA